MYDINHIYEAKSVEDAVRLRMEQPQAIIIAGGSDLLISIRAGDLAGCDLISIYMIDELRGVSLDDDETIRIGSLTSFAALTKDEIIQKHMRVLGEAADKVGGPQIRNIGTIGGNTCNGVTSADTASTLMAVSYTHLDVYKRQTITSWRTRTSGSATTKKRSRNPDLSKWKVGITRRPCNTRTSKTTSATPIRSRAGA